MGTMAVASDITERKTAERSLRESEGRFRQVVENAPAGIYIQTGGRFRYLNHVAIEAFGATSADQLLDRPIPELIHPDFRDRVEDRVKILVDDKKPVPQLEEKYLKLDGTSFDVEVSAVPFVYGNVNGSLVFFRDITEHKQAQAALRESEWRVQTTVQASGIGLWDWCIRYDYVYYSPEWKAQLGYADEEIGATQAEWEERLHPEDRERTMAQLREYIADPSESFEAEFRMRHKDGTYRWILARGALVRDEDGSPRRVLGSSVDLTERKQVEEELRQHRLLVQSILDATPDLIYIYDLEERRNVFANRQVAEFLGFTGDEIESLGEDLMPELLHPEDASRVADHHARCAAAADGEVIELEYRMRHADGRWRWLHSRDVVFFRDTDGMARQILGLAQDVTERRLAEDALRTNEARLGRAQRIAALGDWEILWRRPEDGAADEVHSWSAEVYRIFGVSRESFTPSLEAFFSSVHPDDREAERAAIRTCRETGQPYRSEYRIVRPDGTVRHVREQGELERDAAGAVRMIGTVQDITEHKHLQDQLLQAQRLESVGRLAGGVAHDFNNLLMVIIGYTELMLVAPELNAGIEEPLNEIRKAAERAAELTQQLLAFSRKQVAQPRVIDLNALIRDTENMLRRLIGEDVLLVTQLRPDLASVKADPGQINQVLMNLAVNARDAMPNGGKLVLETRHVEFSEADAKRHPYVPTGRYVSLVVSDTGSGVDEHARSHLFEPFFTTKDRTKGTGLGLSTVYGIVKQAGGHIWVYSEVGRGTAFHICLPRVEDKPAAEAPKVRPTNVRGSETILVVEDQAEVRRLAREVLEGFGYTVLDAASAAEALDVSEAHPSPIHLVLSDVVMPEMTGRDLVDRLKPLRPETKVLFMSGYTDNVILHQGALPTGVAYLQKPFTPEALALKVREVLG
jgi:two-component system cell cycle sensor histidine kinase/response regulator CckA